MSSPAPNRANPLRRRSSTGATSSHSAASSNSSTASQRARGPSGATGSWNWGKAQPKQRLPILDVILRPSASKFSSRDELAIVTSVKQFRILDFGYESEPCRELLRLERELEAAKSSQSASQAIVDKFRQKYPKVKFNDHFAALVESKASRAGKTAPASADIAKPQISSEQTSRQSPSASKSGVTGIPGGTGSTPTSRRSSTLSISDSASNTSTESSRAKLPYGQTGSWAWGQKQPKKRVPILDIILVKKDGKYSYGSELLFKTAQREFRSSDFGLFDSPFKSDLYTLTRILEKAQSFGTSSPLNIVQMFIKQYPKIKYNKAYATLVKDQSFQLKKETLIFLETQFCGRRQDLLYEIYGGAASVTEGPSNIPPNERRIVKVDLLPLNASGYDSTSVLITTYDGKNELLEHPQSRFEDQQDAKILQRLLRDMKEAATYRDAGGILRRTARDFALKYPRFDIVAKRLVKQG
jgi:hypothetical protein